MENINPPRRQTYAVRISYNSSSDYKEMEYADISLKMNARKEIIVNSNIKRIRPNQRNIKLSCASIIWKRIIVNTKINVHMLMGTDS